MDRRGHTMHGMDSVYIHVTDDTRKRLCGYLQGLWEKAIAERYELAPRSAVPLLDQALVAHAKKLQQEAAEKVSTQQRLRARRPAATSHEAGYWGSCPSTCPSRC
jgi:hypothetical protein